QYRVQRADLVPGTTISGSGTYTNNLFGAVGASGAAAGGAAGGTGAGTGAGTGSGVGTGAGTGGTGASVGTGGSSNLQFYSVN
ncbi:hypothetical protein, partial [Clostridium perfringens]